MRRLALIYVGTIYGSADSTIGISLEPLSRQLLRRSDWSDRAAIRQIMNQAFEQIVSSPDAGELVLQAAGELAGETSRRERQDILKELRGNAGTDVAVSEGVSATLRELEQIWSVPIPGEDGHEEEAWGVLHDLAYIYLVLAHSTDNDLSETEMQVILTKLGEWQPDAPLDDVRRMVHLAISEYAEGQDSERLDAAIESVRSAMPRGQRMAALTDLVKIANADGVFLDDEEDLINHLQSEWDVEPYASYAPQPDKSADAD